MNCEWCAQFDKSPDPDARRYMAYGCSNTVSLRQWVINREKRALKISRFPRSARNLNRKRWCYSSDLPRKTATFKFRHWVRAVVKIAFRNHSILFSSLVIGSDFSKEAVFAAWLVNIYILDLKFKVMESLAGLGRETCSCWKLKAVPWHWLFGVALAITVLPLCKQKDTFSVILPEPLLFFSTV